MATLAKKFGTFAGVFTPSVLTILGVIMYMRLGWVVGQSGLYIALGIILLAHFISFTTGLSLSSISTDKKIKKGGIYYILSRSLGLPMGGAIGITLFVGTALSISLYIVGFCESFLGMESISSFLGMGLNVADIRILGTGVIIGLVILAYISTSLAIRSQFFILGAIALSIVSIVVGMVTKSQFHPEIALTLPAPSHISFKVVFAIFFPAVTGFTAGVAMSGDLKDPKKSIPLGTMASIITGLVIYVALTLGFAFFIDRDLLLNDSNFLIKIAWFSPLVIAGIWGASLSSALGGILGAPRIIQATSLDKITPKFLGKGSGVNSEPRNALFFTFILAEIGILIGELDVIAGVVSMFYLAAYGFINLAYFLESWASSDFRPSFRISRWNGLLGFLACLIVMFQIDALASVGAFVIMFLLFFMLKRREIKLDYGDVWQSVWASVIRSILDKLDKQGLEERNWKPNIILFSGGTNQRPHLLEIGKSIAGKQGFLSNFDLIENRSSQTPLSFREQSLEDENSKAIQGFFARQKVVKNIYEGIENIASTYGFAGVEPNTVMMGWGRSASDPKRFGELITSLNDLDHNIVMMDYDKQRGFGKYSKIDIWWRGAGNNGNLAITLVKFLNNAEDWRNATVRLLIVNPLDEDKDRIYTVTKRVLESLRFDADIHIINNQIQQRSFFEIIERESVNSDLTILGFPELVLGKEEIFVENTNRLCENIGTVILVKASSTFKSLKVGVSENDYLSPIRIAEKVRPAVLTSAYKIDFDLPEKSVLKNQFVQMHNALLTASEKNLSHVFSELSESTSEMTSQFEAMVNSAFTYIGSKKVDKLSSTLFHRILDKYLERWELQIFKFQSDVLPDFEVKLSLALENYLLHLSQLQEAFPVKLPVAYKRDEIVFNKDDTPSDRRFKLKLRLKNMFRGDQIWHSVYLREIVSTSIHSNSYSQLERSYKQFGLAGMQYAVELHRLMKIIWKVYSGINLAMKRGSLTAEIIEENRLEAQTAFDRIRSLTEQSYANVNAGIISEITLQMSEIARGFNSLNPNQLIPEYEVFKPKTLIKQIDDFPSRWLKNQDLFFNEARLEQQLITLLNICNLGYSEVQKIVTNDFEKELVRAVSGVTLQLSNNKELPRAIKWKVPNFQSFVSRIDAIQSKMQEQLQRKVASISDSIEIYDNEALNSFGEDQYEELKTVTLSTSKMLNYIVQNHMIEPLQELRNQLPDRALKLMESVQEVVNHLSFAALTESHPELENPEQETYDALRERMMLRLDVLKGECKSVVIELQQKIEEERYSAEDKLSFSQFASNALNYRTYIRKNKKHSRIIYLREFLTKTERSISHLLNQLWYRQSKGLLLDLRMHDQQEEVSEVDAVLTLVEAYSPSPEVVQNTPFFYRQMFIGKNQFLHDFWVGRFYELAEADRAVARFRSGRAGGLLVLGDYNSGKSFFIRQLLINHWSSTEPSFVQAPEGGSIDPTIFDQTLSVALGNKNQTPEQLLEAQHQPALIVIDDLQLWWEKSTNGTAVLERLTQLMMNYSGKHLFLVSATTHSFGVMQRLIKTSDLFLNIINLKPFSAEELQKIVLLRHHSSQFHFNTQRKSEEHFRSWNYARLFSRLFDYSKGNAGIALSGWMANVEQFENERLTIKDFRIPDSSALGAFSSEEWILILQLYLHKSASFDKLCRIAGFANQQHEQLSSALQIMIRSGVIEVLQRENQAFYHLNSFVVPAIQYHLKSIELL